MMLYVSTEAYRKKTGIEEENETFPRNVAFQKGLSYDFVDYDPEGEDWKKEDLPSMFPKLWDKFN